MLSPTDGCINIAYSLESGPCMAYRVVVVVHKLVVDVVFSFVTSRSSYCVVVAFPSQNDDPRSERYGKAEGE